MWNRCLLPALALGLTLVLSSPPQAVHAVGDKGDKADRVQQLIQQLGSPKFAVRDRAKKELESMGPAALEALRKAAKSEDMETSRRAGELVRKLEDKMTLDSMLQPKKVNLKLKDVSVMAAVDELSKQSGYPIQVDGDRTQLAKRKITLETGETTFWQAFDQLCQKGGLSEVTPPYNPSGYYPRPIGRQPIGRQPIQIQPIQLQPIQIQPINPPIQIKPLPPVKFKLGVINARDREMMEKLQKLMDQLQKELENNGNGKGGLKLPPLQLPNFQPARNGQADRMEKEMQKLLEKMIEQLQKEAPQLPAFPQLQPAPNGNFNFQVMQINGQAGQAGQAGGKAQVRVQKGVAAQVMPAQVRPAIQPIGGRTIRPINPLTVNTNITVRDGAPQTYPTSYAGAVRVRVVPLSQQPNVASSKKDGEVLLLLEVIGEPRMQHFGVVGNAMIDKAMDNHGQSLFVTMDPVADNNPIAGPNGRIIIRGGPSTYYNPNLVQRYVVVRLKAGEKQSKALKVLTGNLTAQMMSAPEALIRFDNLLKAAGKEAKGPNGGKVEVVGVNKLNNGDVRVQVRIENVQNNVNNVIRINPPAGTGFNTTQGVAIVQDAKGKAFQLVGQTYHASRFINGVITQEVSLTYRPNGAGEAAALVFSGYRMISMQVPFNFKDLPLQ